MSITPQTSADTIIIAPRVAGYIAEVPVGDNQPVKAGQVLARIDDRDLLAALDQAVSPQDWNTLYLSSPEFMH